MNVKVVDILAEPIKATHLKGIDKLAFDSRIRGRIVSMWDDRDKVTFHLWGLSLSLVMLSPRTSPGGGL